MTQYLIVDARHPEPEIIAAAAAVIKSGGTVAFPTETVYGLGADGLNPEAVENIYVAKGRSHRNPLILHVASAEQARSLTADWPDAAGHLAAGFWPGPLTLILPRSSLVPDIITAGRPNVALRLPSHPVARALIARSGLPIAAPSANSSGRPSPTLAQHVRSDLDGRIDMVLDAGATPVGVESTIIDLSGERPVLLRPGGVSMEDLERVLGTLQAPDHIRQPRTAADGEGAAGGAAAWYTSQNGRQADEQGAPCPGVLFQHYAPLAEAIVVTGSPEEQAKKVRAYLAAHPGRRVVMLATSEQATLYVQMQAAARSESSRQPDALFGTSRATAGENSLREHDGSSAAPGLPLSVVDLGPRNRPQLIASRIFGALRECDAAGAETILMEAIPLAGLGLAVMNRFYRAADGRTL